jgi:4Fe-4S ferredoxin
MELYQLLPKTNCKECGESTCMAFAVKLLSREVKIEDCPFLEGENLERIKEELTPLEKSTKTGLIIHDELCFGCGNCVVACPVNVVNDPNVAMGRGPKSEKVILRVVNRSVLAFNIENCRRFGEEKILCNLCIDTCPSKAIEFV